MEIKHPALLKPILRSGLVAGMVYSDCYSNYIIATDPVYVVNLADGGCSNLEDLYTKDDEFYEVKTVLEIK